MYVSSEKVSYLYDIIQVIPTILEGRQIHSSNIIKAIDDTVKVKNVSDKVSQATDERILN